SDQRDDPEYFESDCEIISKRMGYPGDDNNFHVRIKASVCEFTVKVGMFKLLRLLLVTLFVAGSTLEPALAAGLGELSAEEKMCERLAVSAFRESNPDLKVTYWKRILGLAEKNEPGGLWHSVALRSLADYYFYFGDLAASETYLRRELRSLQKIDPNFADIPYDYLFLGRIHILRNELKPALTCFQKGIVIAHAAPIDSDTLPDLFVFASATSKALGDEAMSKQYQQGLLRSLHMKSKEAPASLNIRASLLARSMKALPPKPKAAFAEVAKFLTDEAARIEHRSGFSLTVYSLRSRGTLFSDEQDYQSAYECFKQALELMDRRGRSEPEDLISVLLSTAGSASSTGRYEEARALYARLLSLLESSGKRQDVIPSVIHSMLRQSMLTQRYKDAVMFGQRELKLGTFGYMLETYGFLTIAFDKEGNKAERDKYLKLLLDDCSRLPTEKLRLARLFELANTFNGTSDVACNACIDRITLACKSFHLGKRKLAEARLKLSELLAMRARFEEAREVYFQVLASGPDAYDEKQLAKTSEIVGSLFLTKLFFTDAQRAFEAQLSAVGSDRVERMRALYLLAHCLVVQRKFREAESRLNQVVKMSRGKSSFGDRLKMFEVYRLLGDCALIQNDEVASSRYYKQCLESTANEDILSKISAQILTTFPLTRQKKFAQAEAKWRKIVALADENGDSTKVWRSSCRTHLAYVLCEEGKYKEALTVIEKSLANLKQVPGTDWLPIVLAVKGRVYSKMNDHKLAQKFLKEAESLMAARGEPYYQDRATTLYWQGLDSLALKDYKSASKQFARALALYDKQQYYVFEFRDECKAALERLSASKVH
ncbi:MAG: tetratricopeptide repeat protein, partial [Cyanobacteria bacterium]|nr:tetratricopeptide repeat protein [Cyanobacteriota bacterium]